MLKYLKNQNGFIGTNAITTVVITFFLVITVLGGIFIGIDVKSTETYDYFKAALEFSAIAVNTYGDLSEVAINENTAKQYFVTAFAKITDTTVSGNSFIPNNNEYPGPIILKSFKVTNVGDLIPYGIALKPGYQAEIEVPVFGGVIPFVGPQYITIPMKYYVAVSTRID